MTYKTKSQYSKFHFLVPVSINPCPISRPKTNCKNCTTTMPPSANISCAFRLRCNVSTYPIGTNNTRPPMHRPAVIQPAVMCPAVLPANAIQTQRAVPVGPVSIAKQRRSVRSANINNTATRWVRISAAAFDCHRIVKVR